MSEPKEKSKRLSEEALNQARQSLNEIIGKKSQLSTEGKVVSLIAWHHLFSLRGY